MLAIEREPALLLCVLAGAQLAAPQWEAMLDALDAISPLVDDAAVGHVYLDMRGVPGSPQTWIAQTRASLEPFAVPARIGAASNKFTAYAAARTRDGATCCAGEESAFLAPLSLDLLDVDERVRERLRLLGIATLGELARLPHGPFVRRFGMQAARWHACARGEDRTPFLPRAHAVAIEATTFGEGQIEEEAQLFFALRLLLASVCTDLDRCGKRAGMLELGLELEDGSDRAVAVPIALASADEKMLGNVLRAKLSGSTFSCAIVGVRLRAVGLEEGGEPMTIFPADDVDPRRVAVTLARLEAVTGETPYRARTKPAHTLERRFAFSPFLCPRHPGRSAAPCHPERSAAPCHPERSGDECPREVEGPPEVLVAQLRFLAVREIDVVVKHCMPTFVDARAVIACEGPWRIEEGWFSESPIARDEFDVVLADKSMLRIYRQGTRWYLRGAYD